MWNLLIFNRVYDPVYDVNTFLTLAVVTLRDLVTELEVVVNWFKLGIQLDISSSKLRKIRADHRVTDACKTEMLMMWMDQTTNASWTTVVRALQRMRMETLAQSIAAKYGESVLHRVSVYMCLDTSCTVFL